jgi:hypothetical protein
LYRMSLGARILSTTDRRARSFPLP